MADHGNVPQERLQRTASNSSSARSSGSKLPRRERGKKRRGDAERKADSEAGPTRQDSQLSSTSTGSRAEPQVEQSGQNTDESMPSRVAPSQDFQMPGKFDAVSKSGGNQKSGQQSKSSTPGTAKSETASRILRSPEPRTGNLFEGAGRGEKRSTTPQAQSTPRTPDFAAHRRAPSSAPSVASGNSNAMGGDEPSSPDTQVDTPTSKIFKTTANAVVYKKMSQEGLSTMNKHEAENLRENPTSPTIKEESFVLVSKRGTTGHHATSPSQSSEKILGNTDAHNVDAHNGPTYADVLKEGPGSYDGPRDADTPSDDSYPELDPMDAEDVYRVDSLMEHHPVSRIRWAPLDVPAKRRLQTLMVLAHCLSIAGLVSMFFALCAIPFAWPLLLLYLLHVLSSKAHTDGSLSYRSEWARRSYVWHLFAGYFPAKLHKTHDLPDTRKYIFGYHPHGIISHGAWAAFATEALGFGEKFPGITNSLLTLDSNFRIPFYRDYILGMGTRSVSKESIVNILTRGGRNKEGMGRAVTIVIGGARESLEAQPGQMRLILKERKGFIKIAVRCGADLVPVLAFGENDLYDQLRPKEHPLVHKVQKFVLRVWKFTLPFLHGRGIFNYDVGLMPYRHPLNIVVGAPIKVTQSNHVDNAEIDRLHGLYVDELEKLWDRYKDKFAKDRKEEMQILT